VTLWLSVYSVMQVTDASAASGYVAYIPIERA
jgi:hypothetical protein